ncbi:MAG TPA: T9SS type A sorting domain-containing protein [Ignavibacteria bacterium]|nr:T9SS type A sorting domain-containing protein [Ignavibacteria bacterium]HMQ98527.1 T9SS type A sorting domain-containing protein [Ignavibacteria bacterium]
MKSVIILFIILCSLLCCTYIFSQQSDITFYNGSSVDIQLGADVCADVITINGTYSGGGSICTGALPVTLSLFNALSVKNNVKLYWKTEAEINNSGFEIERKPDGGSWLMLAFIAGSGTTNQPVEYTYEDKKLQSGKYFYRLKQIDYNGNYEYFDLALPVVISKPTDFALGQSYPNPSNPKSNIDFQLPERTLVNISVYNLLGQLVSTLINEEKDAGIYTIEFDGSNLTSGVYFYRINAENFSKTKKMLLVK